MALWRRLKPYFWIVPACFSAFILSMAFGTRPLLDILDPLGITFPMLYAAITIFTCAGLFLIWKNRKRITPKSLGLLAAISACYFYFYHTLAVKTEFFHLIIFSILVIMIQQSLPDDWAPWEYYFWPALLTLFVGAVDEFMQLWIPMRWGDAKDIGFCGASILLGTLLSLALGFKPYSRQKHG